MAILHPRNPGEKGQAIQSAGLSPPLFAEMAGQFAGQELQPQAVPEAGPEHCPLHRRQYRLVLGRTKREMLHGPLSRAVSYRLLVRGGAGPKENAKLIKILELQKSLLEDDDEYIAEATADL